MGTTHAHLLDNPSPVVPANDIKIQINETQYDKPPEVPFIRKASPDYDPK